MNTELYLLFKHIKIQSANAISGPLSYGFPAVNGFVGAMHALSRKLCEKAVLGGVIITCHNYGLQSYQSSAFSDRTFIQTRNPLKKDGKTAPIIEEGKIHLEVSLVVELQFSDRILSRQIKNNLDGDKAQAFLSECKNQLLQQRIAGGSVLDIEDVQLHYLEDEWKIKNQLLPGFVLMNAQNELMEITKELQQGIKQGDFVVLEANPDATSLDALIETSMLHHIPNPPRAKESEWQTYSVKQGRGWLVPIPVGYQAISPMFAAGQLQHCRTQEYPSQYVETLYSLGKWVLPLNLPEDLSHCFWRYTEPKNGLYLISQGEQ
ncbi:type I-F CRISPR-associated protein Csy2 [Rodentibacter ratti]|uniref:type I-F CRISPR-associated protein Csy2 n=1 Tax=Rodentibacter ratti TaxID=1906745 RepID=UPI000985B61A|nr:type I-F CRISPR-associated protein Csy2 [Rodentibacter ratti]OOF88283.1 type I-F CRISPR-associated protein Csy2 [Rodentibacter ratti]